MIPEKQLHFLTRLYPIVGNQSIVILAVTSAEDEKFKLQFRFIAENNKKLKLTPLKNFLKENTKKITGQTRSTIALSSSQLSKNYFESSALSELRQNTKHPEFIYNKMSHHLDTHLEIPCKANNPTFYALETTKTIENKIQFGYEMPKDPCTTDALPIYHAQVIDTKEKLIKKIYLFPINRDSLEHAKKSICDNQDLTLPFVVYYPNRSNDRDTQIRINLQGSITETLIQLKKVKCFRKGGEEKYKLFLDLAQKIAQGISLTEIKKELDSHDKWKILSQHRDPWGPFAFFKGNTRSLDAWNDLKKMIDIPLTAATSLGNH